MVPLKKKCNSSNSSSLRLWCESDSFLTFPQVVRNYLRRGSLKPESSQIIDLYRTVLTPHAMRKRQGATADKVLSAAKKFTYRMVASDFLRHVFGISFRSRAEKTSRAARLFAQSDEIERISFKASNAFSFKRYSLSLPLLYVTRSCAPENNDRRFRLRDWLSERQLDLIDKRRTAETVSFKLKTPLKQFYLSIAEKSANTDAARASEADNNPVGEGMQQRMKRKERYKCLGVEGKTLNLYECASILDQFSNTRKFREINCNPRFASRDLGLMLHCLTPDLNYQMFIHGRGNVTQQHAISSFWNAVKLTVDCGLKWQAQDITSVLEMSPPLSILAFPHRDVFDQDFAYMEEEMAVLIIITAHVTFFRSSLQC